MSQNLLDGDAMRRVWTALVLVVSLVFATAAADVPTNLMYWSVDRPLTWSDFSGTPPDWAVQGQVWVASPDMFLCYDVDYAAPRNGSTWTAYVATFTATCGIRPSTSWAIASRTSAAALHHEQLHFDLYEAYRRLVDNMLRPMTYTSCVSGDDAWKTLRSLQEALWSKLKQRANDAELQFDHDTDNGRNLEAQATWETRIAAGLANPSTLP